MLRRLLLLTTLLLLLIGNGKRIFYVESFSVNVVVDRSSSSLYRGGRLDTVEDTLDRHHNRLSLLSYNRRRRRSRSRFRRQEQSDNTIRLFGVPTISIRDWGEEQKGTNITIGHFELYSFLKKFAGIESNDGTVFDPEGLLEYDCGSDTSIAECYDKEDGSRFLVATHTTTKKSNKSTIVGTAAIVVGTSVSYMKSGSSLSTPQIVTGAIRRCCVAIKADDKDDDTDDDDDDTDDDDNLLLQDLLEMIESHAKQVGVQELILLAYNPPTTSTTSYKRPTPDLVESMGYSELPTMKKRLGNNVLQYRKLL